MYKLVMVFLVTFAIQYKAFFIVDYINKKDEVNIKNSLGNRVIISTLFSLVITMLYLKYESLTYIVPLFIGLLFVTILGYIDYYTKYVYSIVSIPLIIIGFSTLILNILMKTVGFKVAVLIVVISAVFYLISKLGYIGEGDVEVIIGLLLLFSRDLYILIFTIFFAFGISGITGLYLLVFKKVNLNHSKPFIPSLGLALYLLMFLY